MTDQPPFEHIIDPENLREVLSRPDDLTEWLDGQLRASPPTDPAGGPAPETPLAATPA